MEKEGFNVLVNGMGNIGTTLTNLLLRYKKVLKLNKIYVAKRSIYPWNEEERNILTRAGVEICTENGQGEYPPLSSILPQIDYIFEATANGVGMANLTDYKKLSRLKGSAAQGSEKGYGIPFMSGVNNAVIKGAKFVQVVSCNTHGSAAILKTLAGENLENLEEADFVVVRRSEDLGNHQRLVSANVVARHLDPTAGTHHSVDVIDLFKTKNIACQLTSSDVTTPSQLMHAVRFNIRLKNTPAQAVNELLAQNPFISITQKFDSNVVFEMGRRYGFNGRIFSHAIVVSSNLLINGKTVKGWAFVPQEGNSILSTLHAYILQMELPKGAAVFEKIQKDLLRKAW